jgi:hypothetical protein
MSGSFPVKDTVLSVQGILEEDLTNMQKFIDYLIK